ncbi:hypothetical protein OVA24_16110 [Luteolibacter sp. SL250]|uniref:hypothetical protein n=1 Tax=Luteolibacter sp. SL250 TaxID=2995170 RepID=UPI00227170B1|nr:hypothetical protein [Luteolibacter sp. SL250]WAC18754.1 hypothetical protein OVA24_16110 [Luteolibacter sp. SL250]
MSESTEKARRWNGYVCPDCRFVFRVPRDHDGRGVICPSCRRMLRVPAAGEATPPLVERKIEKVAPVSLPESFQRAREKKAAEGGAAAAPAGELRRRRREPSDNEQPDWEKAPTERLVRVGKHRKSNKVLWWAGGLLGTAAVVALAVAMLRKEPEPALMPIAVAPVREAAPVAAPASVPEAINLPQEMNRSEAELTAELEPLTRGFLQADTVEKLLPFVRDADKVEGKIRAWYPDGKVPAPGMSAFNTKNTLAYRGRLISVSVRTEDFEEKQIAFLRGDDGLKVDWESFVAWSEMPWPRFISEKPEQPVLFRVALKTLEYYNFGFADDRKWQSYELRSPDREHVLYGYVRRDSSLDGRVRPLDGKSTRLVTVKLKYLPGDVKRNQVVIEELVSDGWVEGAGD